jgi:nicotinamidase-related amidase
MSQVSHDLHGSAPDESKTALLLIDVINDFDFPEAEQLLEFAAPMSRQISALARRARAVKLPVIYVNDNFGRWRSDFRAQVNHCLQSNSRGRSIVKVLRPENTDYFVLKPKHSGFFSTTLDTLLEYLGTETVILTGIAANICVLFTANDAYMRDLRLVVPSDCVASNSQPLNEYALKQMATVLKAQVLESKELTEAALSRLKVNRQS